MRSTPTPRPSPVHLAEADQRHRRSSGAHPLAHRDDPGIALDRLVEAAHPVQRLGLIAQGHDEHAGRARGLGGTGRRAGHLEGLRIARPGPVLV